MNFFKRWKKPDIEAELHSTNPDYIVYVPKSPFSRKATDTGNEHFLVFEGPSNSLMAVWTQSSQEGAKNQRIVFSKSNDKGITWDEPRVIAGPKPPARGNMASWGFPLVSKKGRIYVLYSQHIGIHDTFFHTSGILSGIYSDDNGNTWSNPDPVPIPRSIHDNPDEKYPTNIIVWQKPLRLCKEKYYCGFTRWVSKSIRNDPPRNHWTAMESVVEFMRFENIDDNPAVRDIKITFLMSDESALRVGHIEDENVSVVQEPSLVKLPDERLFAVMRTTKGHPYYSISDKYGDAWSPPQPLRTRDDGNYLNHPLSPCPIYQTAKDEYFLLFHNHDGYYGNYTPLDTLYHRRPIFITFGKFNASSRQPINFSEPTFLMDHSGNGLGRTE